jgi:phosphohistidine swiveling domain-containing protein
MKLSDYYNFEFPLLPYCNSAHGDHSPKVKYRGEYICGNWYLKYILKGNSLALIPKDSWIVPGRRFLGWIQSNDAEFTEYLYSTFIAAIPLADRLEKMNSEDIKTGKVRSKDEFHDDYIKIWSLVIGFGYPLDMALEEYLKDHPVDMHNIPFFGNSFIRDEEKELKQIALQTDPAKQEKQLLEHSYKYSYVLSNYTGYHPVPLEYFRNRLEQLKNKDIPNEIPVPMHKPTTLDEWIGFATYIRDVRKRCNMIYNAMIDRYLRAECEKLNLNYDDAVLLTVDEFEAKKNTGIPKFNGIRFVEVTNQGMVDLKEEVWNNLITEADGKEVKGIVASKGIARGVVKVIYGAEDFHKMEKGNVIVTSMTRPDFAPILPLSSAIITNEGGVTCHAAIISREMKIPCVIATRNATAVLKDGDMVEVDAEKGIVKIIK